MILKSQPAIRIDFFFIVHTSPKKGL